MKKRRKRIDYGKWGYIFILPFFLIFFIFSFIPLVDTIRYSFFEYYRDGLDIIGPNATVARYFTGQEEYYQWQIDDASDALDELTIEFEDVETSPELKDEILSTVTEIAEDIEVKKLL